MTPKTTTLLACAASLVLAGCGGSQPASSRRLAFITNNAADFWTIARKGVEKADAELGDASVEFRLGDGTAAEQKRIVDRSEEHTSELQSLRTLVCRLLLEK